MSTSAAPVPYVTGSLVRARGREWVVLPQDDPEVLRLRPLGGTDTDAIGLFLPLEGHDVQHATFALPDPTQAGDHTAGLLLRDAVRLGLRTGAGPFRSLGRIAVEPRPYQLVPLLMALKLAPIRLLIADDVGVGKTIEAGLIARELLDRGEIRRLCVLCPPHLCEQWQAELAQKFHLDAEVVRPGTVARLERGLPLGHSLFDDYPIVVVSIDYIKSDRRRADFVRACPEFIIVDEAHMCAQGASTGGGQHQRHQLLTELARDPERHLVLSTATPHSGVEAAFRSLLTLLDPALAALPEDLSGAANEAGRRMLAARFVQRRRADVRAYLDERTPFPDRLSTERTYTMSKPYQNLFDRVLAYVNEMVRSTEGMTLFRRRVRWWAALALLRCVSSSPTAAIAALATRVGDLSASDNVAELDALGERAVLDLDTSDAADADDTVPGADASEAEAPGESERRRLRDFTRAAEALKGSKDAKLVGVVPIVTDLLADGFRPILYCRYIATAEYLADELRRRLSGTEVVAVTGALPQDERMARVAALAAHERRVLVATDCLSEGINLQDHFDAVIHYDLSWNPTRHEQREGRVDRYGQPRPDVRTVLYYGADNKIDGAILNVLLRKAESIRKSLGVAVPLPQDSTMVLEAIFEALFMRGRASPQQLALDFGEADTRLAAVEAEWENATEREKRSRTLYAQAALKPDEVARELREAAAALGDHHDVERFVRAAAERLHVPFIPYGQNWQLATDALPAAAREASGLSLPHARIGFQLPVPDGVTYIARTHPLVEALGFHVAGTALDTGTLGVAARCGAIRTRAVATRTTLLVLRLRFHLDVVQRGDTTPLLAEECLVAAFQGAAEAPTWLSDEAPLALLKAEPSGNVPPELRTHWLTSALEGWPALQPGIERLASERAEALLAAHRRVRDAAGLAGVRYSVRPQLPADLLGLYIFMPMANGVVPSEERTR